MICLLMGHKPSTAIAMRGEHAGKHVTYCAACGKSLSVADPNSQPERGYRDYEAAKTAAR